MKKILLQDNTDKAKDLISKIETLYLSRVSTLVCGIKNLGIEGITKELVLEAIEGKFDGINELYNQIYKQDLELFKTKEMRHQVEAAFTSKFYDVIKAAEAFQDKDLRDYLPFSLQVLAGIFELDEKGTPYIPEERKAVIIEGFKEWISSPDLLRVYNLHLETAQKIEELVTAIRKNGIDRINFMNTRNTMGSQSVGSLFLIEDNIDTGIFSVKPRRMDYKMEEEA